MSDATIPWRRDPVAVGTVLQDWARATGTGKEVTEVRMPGSGASNDTVIFELDGERLVARLAPAPDSYPTFMSYDFPRQQRTLELIRSRTSIPLPEVFAVEIDDSWLGVPFMVFRAVDGVVAEDNPPYLLDPNSWVLQGTDEQRERFQTSTIGVLVQLHTIDGSDAPFLDWDTPGDTALARQLEEHRQYYEWAHEGHRVPLLERALEILGRTLPSNDRAVVNWGDARPGNIMYRDFEPVAVLDWEMAALGPPEIDLAWVTFFQQFWGSMAEQYGLPPVLPMFDPTGVVATYERLGGGPVKDLTWYETLSGLRLGIILVRMSLRAAAFGTQELPSDPDDLMQFAPLLRRLLDRLE